jgi:hypothetical protein
MNQHEAYKLVLLDGCDIEHFQLSLCDLRNSPCVNVSGYQVYCDNYKIKHNHIYENIDEAVRQFIELKSLLEKK